LPRRRFPPPWSGRWSIPRSGHLKLPQARRQHDRAGPPRPRACRAADQNFDKDIGGWQPSFVHVRLPLGGPTDRDWENITIDEISFRTISNDVFVR
jgi:hypothetical protein